LNVVVWIVGALTLVGAPLLGGFVAQQMISTGAVRAAQIIIPLVGLAWASDALLALALLRTVAPAFAAARLHAAPAEEVIAAAETDALVAVDEGADETATVEEVETIAVTSQRPSLLTWAEAPGIVYALLAVIVGAVPSLLLTFGAVAAAESLTQSLMVSEILKYSPTGYIVTPAQWLPGLVWIAALLLGLIVAVPLLRARTRTAETYLGGQSAEEAADPARFPETAGLAPPGDAWSDLRGAMDSGWTTPGRGRLLDDLEAASEPDEAGVEAVEIDAGTDAEAEDSADETDETSASRERVSKAGEQS
jgi:NADH:ubiquinone oxidoreductase subunit 5 (subunit L)/multisubunit Na+/H+ antiporter MnhA subunit